MKLSIGEVLGEAWNLYARHAGKLIVMAAIVFGFLSLVAAAIGPTRHPGLLVVVAIVYTVGLLWLQGAMTVAVGELRAGRTIGSIGELFDRVAPRLLQLIFAGILVAIGVGGGFILFYLPGLVLLTLWMAVTPAVVLERKGVLEAFGRSYELVRGDGLRVFAVIAITTIFSTIIAALIRAVLTPLPDFFDIYLAGVIANAVVMPFVALAWTITYFDLKLNKDPRWRAQPRTTS
jgi:hypothetical protein